ncbi:hypothetical protein ACHAPQ_009722, partial [Fusarium lateritium]
MSGSPETTLSIGVASFGIDQSSQAIRNLIRCWLTGQEAKAILSQFRKSCIPNRQVLWSGMLRETAQKWADAHDFQTLTTSLGPLLHPGDPDCPHGHKSQNQWSKYFHGASIVFAWFISQGDLVTVLSQPPPQRFHPSGQSFYQLYEEPIIKGKLGNRPVKRIVVAHPTIKLAINFTYEMWPDDKPSLWTEAFGMPDIVIYWRKVKTTNHVKQSGSTSNPTSLPASSKTADGKPPENLAVGKTKGKKKKSKKVKGENTTKNETLKKVKKITVISPSVDTPVSATKAGKKTASGQSKKKKKKKLTDELVNDGASESVRTL